MLCHGDSRFCYSLLELIFIFCLYVLKSGVLFGWSQTSWSESPEIITSQISVLLELAVLI